MNESERGSDLPVLEGADRAGLRPRDVIVAANRRKVETVADLCRETATVPEGGNLLLSVERDGGGIYVVVALDG